MTLRLTAVHIAPAICMLLAAGMSAPALAQPSAPAQPLLDDKFVFSVGAFVVQSDLKAGLNGQSTTNPDIDFNDTFGRARDATRVRADALWRITPTQHVRFMYFDDTNRSSRVLDRTVNWGDYTFQVGANVDSETKFTIAELAYEWAFVRSPSYELGATIRRALHGHAHQAFRRGDSDRCERQRQPGRFRGQEQQRARSAAGHRPARRLGGRSALVRRCAGPVLQDEGQRR